MKPRLTELVAAYHGEAQRWGETVVVRLRDASRDNLLHKDFTAKGTAPIDELKFQQTYRWYGRWSEYRGERQFLFQTYVRSQPHSEAGVVRYLQTAPHVGPATARKLWEKFGSDGVRVLRESPDAAAAAVERFSEADAAEASAWLVSEQHLELCSIDLIGLIGNRGFPKTCVNEAIRRWGGNAAAKIRKSPYILQALRGIGFARADALYIELGLPPAAIKRQALCAYHAMHSNSEGHTWHPVAFAAACVEGSISGAEANPGKALKLGKRAQLIAARRDAEGKLWVADAARARAEGFLAGCVARMMA